MPVRDHPGSRSGFLLPEDFPVILTPGAYLKMSRNRAGLSVEEVAHDIATEPSIAAHERAGWLRLIEADAAPLGWNTLVALRQRFRFSLAVLERFSLISGGVDVPPPVLCVICAEDDQNCLALGALLVPGPITLCMECASFAKATPA